MDSSYFGNTHIENNYRPSNSVSSSSSNPFTNRAMSNNPLQNKSKYTSIYPTNDHERTPPQVSKTEQLRAKIGTDAVDLVPQFQTMPTLFLIVVIIYFVIAPILMLRLPALDNSSVFLQTQMWINCSLIVSFSVVYGILTLAFPKEFVTKYRNFILPLFLIVAMWLKEYFTYKNSLGPFCAVKTQNGTYNADTSPYNIGVLMWNTSKVPIAIFVTYVFVVLFPQTVVPFNEFFCGEEVPHPLVEFFSIGFWIGCATWPSEASCYFEIIRDGCQPVDNINFESINQEIKDYNNENDND